VISAAGTKRVECSAKISPAKAGQPGRIEATVPTSTILAAAHRPKGQVRSSHKPAVTLSWRGVLGGLSP
jgi:hypothetical protein